MIKSIKKLLQEFDIIGIRQAKNIDLLGLKQYGSHFFVHEKVKKQ